MKLVFPGGEHPQVLLGQGINRVGSDPRANIVLDRPGVMPQHCQLHVTEQGVMLSVTSGMAVSVNGRPVDGLIRLRPGDCVGFDQVQARLAALEPITMTPDVAAGCARPAANDDPGATAVRPVLPRFTLRVLSGSATGRSYPLVGPVTVGRSSECEVQLSDDGISRRHARLVPAPDGVRLEDLGSSNGSCVNGKPVLRTVVRAGDEIGFDSVRFRLLEAGTVEPRHIPATVGRRRTRVPPGAWLAAGVVGLVVLAGFAFLL
jgi:pSer/pThr/pTyr-binding forkhead associated (FHA) protein